MSDLFDNLNQNDVNDLGEMLQKTIQAGLKLHPHEVAQRARYEHSAEHLRNLIVEIEKKKGLKPIKPEPPQPVIETPAERISRLIFGS